MMIIVRKLDYKLGEQNIYVCKDISNLKIGEKIEVIYNGPETIRIEGMAELLNKNWNDLSAMKTG